VGVKLASPHYINARNWAIDILRKEKLKTPERIREVADRAFVSAKTVEANLSRVYDKLGVHSRAELGRVMSERERAAKT